MRDTLHWVSFPQRVTFKLCLLTYKCRHGLAPDYLSRFCTLLTSIPGRPLLRSADANKLLVPRSCTASFGLRSIGSSSPTAWNDMPAHLRNLDLPLSDFRQFAENRFVPDCSSVVTARTFVTVNLLIERFEMPVWYYYYLLANLSQSQKWHPFLTHGIEWMFYTALHSQRSRLSKMRISAHYMHYSTVYVTQQCIYNACHSTLPVT